MTRKTPANACVQRNKTALDMWEGARRCCVEDRHTSHKTAVNVRIAQNENSVESSVGCVSMRPVHIVLQRRRAGHVRLTVGSVSTSLFLLSLDNVIASWEDCDVHESSRSIAGRM